MAYRTIPAPQSDPTRFRQGDWVKSYAVFLINRDRVAISMLPRFGGRIISIDKISRKFSVRWTDLQFTRDEEYDFTSCRLDKNDHAALIFAATEEEVKTLIEKRLKAFKAGVAKFENWLEQNKDSVVHQSWAETARTDLQLFEDRIKAVMDFQP